MEDGSGKIVPHKTPKNLTNNKYESEEKLVEKDEDTFSDDNIDRNGESDKDSIKDETIE